MPGPSTRRRTALVVLLVAAVVSLAAAVPAGAWVRDFQSLQLSTLSNSTSPKLISAPCPAKAPLGAGATVPDISNLGLQRLPIGPAVSGQAASAGAAETDSVSARWPLIVRAFCALETGTAPTVATGAPYLKQVTIERNESRSNSNSPKTVEARCPDGTNSIGGGGAIEGATSEVAHYSVQRLGTGLRVRAHETDATGAQWAVQAHAICANITTAVATASYVGPQALTTPESFSGLSSLNKSATVTCAPGRFIIGGGADTVTAGGAAPPSDVVLKASRPGGDDALTNQWTASAVEVDPTGTAWQLRVRAVCATLNGAPL